MKSVGLKIVLFVVGFSFLAIHIAARNEHFFSELIKNDKRNSRYTDLYNIARVSNFKEQYPPYKMKMSPPSYSSYERADLIIWGDSYTGSRWSPQSFAEQLKSRFNVEIAWSDYKGLKSKNVSDSLNNTNAKIILLQMVEKNIPIFSKQLRSMLEGQKEYVIESKPKSRLRAMWASTFNIIFQSREEELNLLLKDSWITFDLYSLVADLKFEYLNSIHPMTAAYQEESKWLFYTPSVEHFHQNYLSNESCVLAENINYVRDQLLKRWGIHLIFLPIPDKYAIYHHLVEKERTIEDQFLFKLYHCLDSTNVEVIHLLDEYLKATNTLYFKTDFHWNENGVNIAAQGTFPKLSELYLN